MAARTEDAVTAPAAASRGLAPDWYTDPRMYALEVERIFRREWMLVGRADEVDAPGDFLCFEFLGEPLVMVRDEAGAVRVLSRVCRHRAMPVLEDRGNVRSIVCPYHSWTYALDGALLGAPEMRHTVGFDARDCRLPEVRSECWEGHVFVNFDPRAEALGPSLEGLARRLRNYRLGETKTVRGVPFDGPCEWNWKLMCDNFIEPYHHIGAHRETLEPVMPGRAAVTFEADGPWSMVRMPYRTGKSPFERGVHAPSGLPALEGLDPEERDSLTAVHIFPCSLISLWGTHTEFYRCFPLGPDRFHLEKHFCLPRADAGPRTEPGVQRLVENFVAFRNEDIDICRAVHRGLRSRFAQAATLCHLESAIGSFARWMEARIETQADAQADPRAGVPRNR